MPHSVRYLNLVCKIHTRSRDQVGMGADQLLSWKCITGINIKSIGATVPEISGGGVHPKKDTLK